MLERIRANGRLVALLCKYREPHGSAAASWGVQTCNCPCRTSDPSTPRSGTNSLRISLVRPYAPIVLLRYPPPERHGYSPTTACKLACSLCPHRGVAGQP